MVSLAPHTVDAFLLGREWRDGDRGVQVVLWGRAASGPVRARFARQEAVMFVPRGAQSRAPRRAAVALETFDGRAVDALYFRSQRALLDERARLRAASFVTFEGDVKPHDRFLMERFVTASMRLAGPAAIVGGVLCFEEPSIKRSEVAPPLSVLSLDIETDGHDGPLLAAALASETYERVIVRGPKRGTATPTLTFAPDERALLVDLFDAIRQIDPDVLIGWNVVDFDLRVLQNRAAALGVPFAVGRAGETGRVLDGSSTQSPAVARVPGRVVLDGIATLKSATYHFERYTLGHVSRELLGRGKKIAAVADPVAEIRRMYQNDVDALAAYNLEDCRLVLEIFARARLLEFAMERARLTGLAMDRQGGSVAAFDNVYLPRLHRKGVVAPDVGDVPGAPSPGGHVLDSVPGLYDNVLSFDFRSLYPSIIRTFQIDPWGLHRPGANPLVGAEGARFAREGAILPKLIEALHDARSAAMKAKNDALSRAIKILMNSFYGVLGTSACRFFDVRLPTSITRRGHAVIERARAFFVARGLRVLYGDTDSLFVHVGGSPTEEEVRERGAALAREATETIAGEVLSEHGVPSYLELRFESHYLRFLMPTTRGAVKGSKKRYAGTVRKADGAVRLVVRGLEAVRTDWTPLARRVQRSLLERVLEGEPFEAWLAEVAGDLTAGRLDHELVYRKRLRRDLGEYAGEGAPPHVRAARNRTSPRPDAGYVEYLMTTRGPEPEGERRSPLDYDHYLTKQLAPACDVVLPFMGTSFETIAGRQRGLFRD